MAVLGAYPDEQTTDWVEEESDTTYSYALFNSGPVGALVRYFVWHPKTKLTHVFDARDYSALSASISRLLENGHTEPEIRRAINAFFSTDTAFRHPHPALAFTNKEFQIKLLSNDSLEPKDEIMEFIMNGFVRHEDMSLPWLEENDSGIRGAIMGDHELIQVFLTYPDVAASLMAEVPVPALWSCLGALYRQMLWSEGGPLDKEALSLLKTYVGTLPRSLTSRDKRFTRPTRGTLAEAVTAARNG